MGATEGLELEDWYLQPALHRDLEMISCQSYAVSPENISRNIPSLKYSQYIAEFRSLPTVYALNGSRMSLSLSLCKDHAEGISVMQYLVLSRARIKPIVVISNCPSRGMGLPMLFSVLDREECSRNSPIDACERASTVVRSGCETIANCKPWIPNICPRSHISNCLC